MATTSKRGKGAGREIGGKIKKTVGKALGNEKMQAEGAMQERAGQAEKEAAKASERVKGSAEKVTGAVKGRIGESLGDRETAAEGRGRELKGDVRRKLNR